MSYDFTSLTADSEKLESALAESDIATVAMVLVQLTEDLSLLDEIAGYIKGTWDYSVKMPAVKQVEICARLIEAIRVYASEGRDLPPPPDDTTLQRMMSVAVGESVSDDYAAMMREELALHDADPKGVSWHREPPQERLEAFHVVIVGVGMSGLLSAIKLQQAGIAFTVIEKNDAVGKTCYENRYRGCGVDTPNYFYSYSFEPSHEWTEFYSK